ncbi:MAG: glycosyltransferase family 39 protein [Terracidiphilus sp.]|jgi:4-amino-4-deoxy-L-arabinose transferase-like glycosyltransferase
MTQLDPSGAGTSGDGTWNSERQRVRLEWIGLGLLVAAGFLVRFWGLSKMHFWDENVYLLDAEYLGFGKAGYQEVDSRPLLLSILFAGVFKIWHSDYAALTVAALLNALGPAFLYLAGKRIASKSAAAIAALLLAFGPFFVGACPDGSGGIVSNCNGHSLLTDCPALTLILLSFWLLVRAVQRQTDLRFALAGFSMAMAVLMRFGSLSSVGMLALLVFAADRKVRAVVACAAGFVLGIGPYLGWSRLEYGGFLETFRNGWYSLGGPAEPFPYYLMILPAMISWLAVAGLALWGVRRGWGLWIVGKRQETSAGIETVFNRQRIQWEGFLWLWALAVMIFFSSLSHKESRYSIPVAPPLLLLAGIGLSWLVEFRRRNARTVGGLVLAAALLFTFSPDRHRFDTGFFDPVVSEEMTVSEFLKQNLPQSTVLYANQNYPDFAYYSDMTVNDLPESGDQLYDALKHLPAGGILIAYKRKPGDEFLQEPPLEVLDADPHFSRWREFPSLVLYRCR